MFLIDKNKPKKSVVKEYNDQGKKTFYNNFKICQVSASGMSKF